MKKYLNLFIMLAVSFTIIFALSSCAEEVSESYKDYTIRVVDELGEPVSQVMIAFTGEDGTKKTRMTDHSGAVVFKSALAGNYEITLDAGLGSAILKQTTYEIGKDDTDFEVVVRNGETTQDIFGSTLDNAYAYNIHVGEYDSVNINAGEYTYFIFQASEKGIYTFSIESEDESAYVGYFGMPYLVYAEHIGNSHNGKTFDIIIQDIATPYVVGVKADISGKCLFAAKRTADAPFDPEYEPWKTVKATEKYLVDCNTSGKALVDFDIKNKNISVELKDDGYYYTNTGKRVYIRIKTASPYLDPLSLICGFDDEDIGVTYGGYVYDENGNFIEKRRYNDMIGSYMEHCDSTYGVVPLNEELADSIKLHGEGKGWYNMSSGGYLFDGVAVNPDNLWLFICMVEQ